MAWKLVILIIVIVSLITVLIGHGYQIFRHPDRIEIVQIPKVDDHTLPQHLSGNYPLVVGDFPRIAFVPLASNTELDVYDKDPTVYSPKTKMEFGKYWRVGRPKGQIVFHHSYQPTEAHLTKIGSPITTGRRHYLSILPKGFARRVGRTIGEYNIYTLYSGECTFQLYHPKYQRYLPAIKSRYSNYQYTEIRSHELENDNPATRNAKFIEIILRPDQALIIPTPWSYGYHTQTPTVILKHRHQ